MPMVVIHILWTDFNGGPCITIQILSHIRPYKYTFQICKLLHIKPRKTIYITNVNHLRYLNTHSINHSVTTSSTRHQRLLSSQHRPIICFETETTIHHIICGTFELLDSLKLVLYTFNFGYGNTNHLNSVIDEELINGFTIIIIYVVYMHISFPNMNVTVTESLKV